MTSQFIIDELSEIVTPHRKEIIERVLEARTLNIAPVLENIYDRGNTSAVMRSAEAYGFVNFNIIENPEANFKVANRVTKGTEKWLEISKYEQTKDCFEDLKRDGFQIFCTHLRSTHSIDEIDFSKPTAIVLGNEKEGVSEEAVAMSDGCFKVPMYGFAESFNISVAAAVTFAMIHKQREQKLPSSGDLSDSQKMEMYANYLKRTVGSAEQILKRKLQEAKTENLLL